MSNDRKDGHIRITSHPSGGGTAPTLHWGAPTPAERGPVIGSTTNRAHRNVIGTHSGSYGVYRALAVAAIESRAVRVIAPAPSSFEGAGF